MRATIYLFTAICLLAVVKSHAQTDSFIYDGIMRNYNVHVPPSFSSNDTLPVVFSLHGLLMNASSQETYSEFSPLADSENFIVVYPNGLNNSWNSNGSPYHSGVDDVGFLSAIIDTLHQRYHIDLNRVYSCGMSNGGFMSYRLACELSNRIAAIASVTGSMTDSMMFYCAPSRPVPVMRIHGTSDLIVNYNGVGGISSAEASNDYWVQFNSCPASPAVVQIPNNNTGDNCTAEKSVWTPCSNQSEVVFYKVNGGGHTWPGSPDLFGGLGGATNQDFDASEAIWDFFNQYDLNGKRNPLSVKQLNSEPAITIYPNPANDFITVKLGQSRATLIRLTDLAGKTLAESERAGKESILLPVKNVQSGMYFLVCEGNGTIIVKPVLIQ